ncbi:cytochrome P450 [Pseudoalteromonas viridis]|uniref:Cytochrome P450 n=1 Tax=Pseudoalteromonas viridis TaxID=339617 RepID=A0ABX7V4R4_9GAMM|nr:cytochrome P450 [Pseudoalteromonas viridis]QTL35490.1 cytochrome P450 [Pseudoalteromonas viridis]
MMIPKERPDITAMREDCSKGKEDYQVDGQSYAFFNPNSARLANQLNFADMTLPESLFGVQDDSQNAMSWQHIRSGWLKLLKQMDSQDYLCRVRQTMKSHLLSQPGKAVNLDLLIQECIAFSVVDVMICDLTKQQRALMTRHMRAQIQVLLKPETHTRLRQYPLLWYNLRAAQVIRRAIRKRRNSTERKLDLLQSVVDDYPALGMDRALDAMMTLVTAISGPPGAVASCMAAQLLRSEQWQQTLRDELKKAPYDVPALPFKHTPQLHWFIKEALRMWSVPIVFREARCPFSVGKLTVQTGDTFFNSSYFVHRNEQYWPEPHVFNPLRWQQASVQPNTFVPFGWNPRSCIGAQLGTNQLAILCQLLLNELDITLTHPSALAFENMNIPSVAGFEGTISEKQV